jgi:drug/metabolite transporter (DMT)-like permease
MHFTIVPRVQPRAGRPVLAVGESSPGTTRAIFYLNVATLIWGSQHAVIKDLVSAAPPSAVNCARFCAAAAAAAPWLPGTAWRPATNASAARETWAAARELSLFTFAGFALQSVGLQSTSASRSAFLLYLNVKLVPLLALVLYGKESPLRVWASAAVAFAGTALLSFDGSPPNLGDAFSLGAAVASAAFILRLEQATQRGGSGGTTTSEAEADPAELNAATLACSALLFSCWAAADMALAGADGASAAGVAAAVGSHGFELAYLALVVTFGAQWLQAAGQSRVGAADAAVIFALDPLYAAVFANLLLGEELGPRGLAGGALVLAAVLLSRSTAVEREARD